MPRGNEARPPMSQRLSFIPPASSKCSRSAFHSAPLGRTTRVWSMFQRMPSMSRREPGAMSKIRVPASPSPVPSEQPRANLSVVSGPTFILPPWTCTDLVNTSVPFVTESACPFHLLCPHDSTCRVAPPSSSAIGSSSVNLSPLSLTDAAANIAHVASIAVMV